MRKQILAISLLYSVAWAFQQTPIPPYRGKDHPGQPMWCQNEDTKQHAHNCECLAMKPDHPDCTLGVPDEESRGPDSSQCKVWCRKDKCRCKSHCDG